MIDICGTYRKNSIEPLYHLTDCRSRPFISYSHDKSARFRKSITSGTVVFVKCTWESPFAWWQPVCENINQISKYISFDLWVIFICYVKNNNAIFISIFLCAEITLKWLYNNLSFSFPDGLQFKCIFSSYYF